MARTPRASVSKTSGQGVSRLAYQKAYRMQGGPAIKGPGKVDLGSSRDYGKGSSKAIDAGDFNVSYADTLEPTDLKDVEELGRLKPSKSGLKLGPARARKRK